MAVLKWIFMFSVFIVCSNSEEATTKASTPSGVSSRFFDLGGILSNIFGGFNPGNQGIPDSNPPDMGFPANSQFYPNPPIQGQDPQIQGGPGGPGGAVGQGGTWPVIDDASQYPNRPGSLPSPDQTNPGSYPQVNPMYPNQGGLGGSFPGIYGGGMNPQVPPQEGTFPQYPNQGNFVNQNPSQGNFMNQNPGQGNFMNQNPSQGNFMNQNPNQGNFMNQYPGQGAEGQMPFPQYPNTGPVQNQSPNQGGWNQGNFMRPGTGGDGTLDGLTPPQANNPPNNFGPVGNTPVPPAFPDDQEFPGNIQGGSNGGVGRDVIVPSTPPEPGRIFYPSR